MHYYKKNIGDYAKKAGRLSMLQHGSYTLLIDACYDREQFPTLEEAIEWTWASTKEEIEAVEFVLRKFFTLENGVYVQNRIKEEIDQYRENSATNSRIASERETKRKENSTNRAPSVNEPPPNHKPLTSKPVNQEPETNNQEPKIKVKTEVGKNNPDMAVIFQIFEFWQKVMMSPKSVLDTNRNRLIAKALKSYSPADICKAIRGCSRTPHNMGQNERNTKYNGLDLILRNAEKIDYFIRLDDNQAKPANETLDQKNQRIIAEVLGDDSSVDSLTIEMEQ